MTETENFHPIKQQIIEILRKILKIDETHTIKASDRLKEDLGLDSMSSLTFLMALEDNVVGFTVDPDTLDTDDLVSVESITRYVQKQL